jgi:outer membrane receptor protein involved in Fe transport
MKKFYLAVFVFIPFLLLGQQMPAKFYVTGQAIDSVTLETLPYVTCSVVMEKNPQQVVSRFASNIDGKFCGELKSPGNYILIVSCVGQESVQKSFTVDATNHNIQFGKIGLAPAKQTLKEVNVVTTRPLIKADADKITYDVEQDPESKSSTVLDMLRKVPMVTVDGQDNIQLKGSSSFKFFLNGKPTNMFNNNPGLILKSMPSNMVKNIEVITQPGAKYDAEGIGGIINIVTMQQSSAQGYSATVNAQASSRGSYGGGLNLMIQSGKFSFSGNYNYIYNKQFPVVTSTERNSYVPGAPYPRGTQVATVINKTPMQFGSGQLSYELDTANLFTLSFNRRYGRPESTTEAITNNFNAANDTVFSYTQNSTQTQSWGSTDYGLDYQHSFKKKNENLTLSYKLSNTPNSSNFDATNTLNALYTTQPHQGLAQWSKSDNIASTNEHTFQADYTNPIAKGQILELGTKYIIRLNDSETEEEYKYFNFSESYPFLPYLNRDTVYSFNNELDIFGTYASYSANLGKWSLKGGLRYEYTWLTANFNGQSQNISNDYGVFVPSGTVTYRLTDMQNLRLGYNKRIQRPSIGFLNPYVDRRDPNYINYGNPELDPEESHNITLGFNSFAAKYNISTELAYTFVNNGIEQFSFIPDGSTVQKITYGNIGQKNQLGLNVFGSYRGLPWLNLYMNGSVNYVDLKSSVYDFANSGFTGRMFLGGTFMLPKDFRISTGGGGNLPQINLQGSQSAFYFSYMALSKDFLKKRLNVSLSGVFLPKPHIILTTNGFSGANNQPTFTQLTDVHLTKSYEFRLNVSYRIGSMNMQVKKTNKTISNDDQKVKDNSNVGDSPM